MAFRIFVLLALLLPGILLGQRCALENLDALKLQRNPKRETKTQFEEWLKTKSIKKTSANGRTQATYTIPVVVHVIHNGQAVGAGMNISDAQINSQISVLNKDFQRLNADANQTPADFLSKAGSMSIEFVLARQDEYGNAFNGIRRVNGGQSVWELYDDTELKSKSYMPSDRFLNIWVTNIGSNFLGYAFFPVSGLAGLNDSPEDPFTDGIVIDYTAFGSIDDGPFTLDPDFNKGRTLTHEMGHFLGLRHIWGDANSCSATDYVTDTPPQNGSTSGCPSHPATECSGSKMFQNFLDYTNDQCMNLFTVGQVNRMSTVLENSVRRESLLTSPAAQFPGTIAFDLGIVKIESPTELECSGSISPKIEIANLGTTTITQAKIQLKIGGSVVQVKTESLSLGHQQSAVITFNNQNLTAGNSFNFEFKILEVNGLTVDDIVTNNTVSITTAAAQNASLPFTETFDSGLNLWSLVNKDNLTGWLATPLATGGKSSFIDLHSYENEGATDFMYSPVFDLSNETTALLKFEYAHAPFPGTTGDGLYVLATAGCNEVAQSATALVSMEGSALATTNSSTSYFIPDAGDWKVKYVSLNQFLGASKFRLAFKSRNGYGNNVYIDNVEIITDNFTDLALTAVVEPTHAVCENTVQPKIQAANQGSTLITSVKVVVREGTSEILNQTLSTTINPGEVQTLQLAPILLQAGVNALSFEVSVPATTDQNTSNNIVQYPIAVTTGTLAVPLRMNEAASLVLIPNDEISWEEAATNFGSSWRLPAFNHGSIGAEAWMASPPIDFSFAEKAGIGFDYSYGIRVPNSERLTFYASTNCGQTLTNTLWASDLDNIATNISNTSWQPFDANDWQREFFSANTLAGAESVIFYVKAENQGRNNVYLDNIELYVSDDEPTEEFPGSYAIYRDADTNDTKITFNLVDKAEVEIQLYTMQGHLVVREVLPNTLNQTYTLQDSLAPGIYVFRIRIDNTWKAKRYLMRH